MSPVNPKNGQQVTDKIAALPQKVTDLSYDELLKAHEAYYMSRALHSIENLLDCFKEGHIFNKYEIEGMDKLIEAYNIQYKSPLAKALSETKEGK